ncbi:MAG: 3-dehydroquinate synthase [Chthoniobacterales bacterium]|jgi:3-dehydroquinate synthase|nr:3-dehydroquinate synthase [Chthoniobacterales bacterium]
MPSSVITVPVPLQDSPYEILIGSGILSLAGELAAKVVKPCRCVLISDEIVAPLHAQGILESLRSAGFEPHLLTIPAGEASKSMAVVADLCDQMIQLGLDRKSALFALGGGVVGDLAGFVASIHYRGIPIIQLPTTVVAQVDSSIGGKTGVNSPLGKNLIGTFHQPRLVLSDTATLSTLPERIFQEGLAEAIKHAVIADEPMLDLLPFDRSADLSPLIARNAAIKARIVSEDEFETKGTRALLNFGHTIGHAIESVAGYGKLSHGECVAIGMIAALDLSVRLAGLPSDQAVRVKDVIIACGLPTTIPADLPTGAILAALARDKKFDAGAIRFVLTPKLGSALISDKVTLGDVTDIIERLQS